MNLIMDIKLCLKLAVICWKKILFILVINMILLIRKDVIYVERLIVVASHLPGHSFT